VTETTPLPTPRTELRIARAALDAFRKDLISGAFAFRPLPPLPTDGPPLRALPPRVQTYARWLPHGAIVAAALLLTLWARTELSWWEPEVYSAFALTVGIPLIMVLFRPVAAWWLSLAGFVCVALTGTMDNWPWTVGGIYAHSLLMLVVAVRSRPRVSGELWLVTAVVSMLTATRYGGHDNNAPTMIIASGLLLLAVALVRGILDSRQEVVKQVAVTVQERSMRTLLEERTTIARELHDVVAHHMSVVAIQAEAAPYRVTDPPPELTQAFATIRENAVAALTELRRVLGVVRAEHYEAPDAPQPTLAELDTLLTNVRAAGLEVDKVVTGSVRPLPQGVELSAYRIVQEALSNSMRHAPGAPARVEISYVLGGLGLRVVNGPARGPVPPSPGAGHGITGMRERVAMLDGEMTAEPQADGGYETAVFLPVRTGEPV
jgi:signal transduction histidine kinase